MAEETEKKLVKPVAPASTTETELSAELSSKGPKFGLKLGPLVSTWLAIDLMLHVPELHAWWVMTVRFLAAPSVALAPICKVDLLDDWEKPLCALGGAVVLRFVLSATGRVDEFLSHVVRMATAKLHLIRHKWELGTEKDALILSRQNERRVRSIDLREDMLDGLLKTYESAQIEFTLGDQALIRARKDLRHLDESIREHLLQTDTAQAAISLADDDDKKVTLINLRVAKNSLEEARSRHSVQTIECNKVADALDTSKAVLGAAKEAYEHYRGVEEQSPRWVLVRQLIRQLKGVFGAPNPTASSTTDSKGPGGGVSS